MTTPDPARQTDREIAVSVTLGRLEGRLDRHSEDIEQLHDRLDVIEARTCREPECQPEPSDPVVALLTEIRDLLSECRTPDAAIRQQITFLRKVVAQLQTQVLYGPGGQA